MPFQKYGSNSMKSAKVLISANFWGHPWKSSLSDYFANLILWYLPVNAEVRQIVIVDDNQSIPQGTSIDPDTDSPPLRSLSIAKEMKQKITTTSMEREFCCLREAWRAGYLCLLCANTSAIEILKIRLCSKMIYLIHIFYHKLILITQ